MTLIIIPCRLGSDRMFQRPLQMLGNKTIIEHCVEQVRRIAHSVHVITDNEKIADLIGKDAIFSDREFICGTDRVAYAAELLDPDWEHNHVINYQGDIVHFDPNELHNFISHVEHGYHQFTTAYCVNKFVEAMPAEGNFRRNKIAEHIGIYGFTRYALETFSKLPPSQREKEEKLEQLRADFPWHFVELKKMPIEINTQADLDRARAMLE